MASIPTKFLVGIDAVNFDNMQVLTFNEFGLKMPIGGFFWGGDFAF